MLHNFIVNYVLKIFMDPNTIFQHIFDVQSTWITLNAEKKFCIFSFIKISHTEMNLYLYTILTSVMRLRALHFSS